MIYELLLTVGGLGLTAQVAMGFVHGGHGHDGHDAHGGHAHGDGAHGHGGHHGAHDAHGVSHGHDAHGSHGSHEGHGHHDGHEPPAMPKVSLSVLVWLSPLNLFSIALGAGATGMALRKASLGEWLTALLAAVGGIALLILVVRPLWALVLRFASTPAETLAGAVSREGIAASRFDAQGRGVVRVTVDGQTVRVLGVLDTEERAAGETISPGDRLLVTGIDATRNHCRVTKL